MYWPLDRVPLHCRFPTAKSSSPSSALLIFPLVVLFYLFSISTARPSTPGAVTTPSGVTATGTATVSSSLPATPTNTSRAATNPTSCSFTADPGCWWSSTAGILSIVGTVVGVLGVAIAALTLRHNLRTRREDEARRTAAEQAAEQEKQRKNRKNPLKSAFWKKFWGR